MFDEQLRRLLDQTDSRRPPACERVVLTRSRRLTDVSAGLVAAGAQGHAAPVTFNSFLTKMRTGEPAEMATLLDRVNTGPVLRAGL